MEAQGLPEQLRKPCTSEWMTLPLTVTWVNTTCPTCGMMYYRMSLHCNSSNTPASPLLPTMGTFSTTNYALVSMVHSPLLFLMWSAPTFFFTLLYPKYPVTPLTQNYIPSGTIFISTHFIFVSSTFSHRPHEMASVWKPWKLICEYILDILCFSTLGDILI